MTYVKFGVVIALVLILAGLSYLFLSPRKSHVTNADVPGIVLVPKVLGKAQMLDHWHNERLGGIVEVGAQYAADVYGPAPIILDYRRNSPRAHNGIGCFLDRGANLIFERLRKLRTAGGMIVFDVGAVRSGDSLKLLAVAACSSKECRGQKLFINQVFTKKWSWNRLLGHKYSNGVVPTAVILEYKIGPEGQDATIAKLWAEMERVMPLIDLEPARRLAGAQSGSGEEQENARVASDG